jgi:methyl-accepting chemotaxis protein
MVEQSTAASHSLAGEAEELFRLVGQFSIGQVAEAAAKPPARKPPAAPKPALKSRIPVHAPMDRVVSFSRRDGASKAAMAAADDDWSEF